MKKITVLILVMFILLSTLVSCGAAGDGNAMNPGSQPPSMESTEKGDSNVSYAPDANEDYERKIIKTYNLSLETKNYESARDAIVTAAKSFGGYIADSAEKDAVTYQGKKDRYATFTVRVPSEKVDEYVNNISENVSVISKKLSTQDITMEYYDLESQLESLLEQEARIEKLMDEATNYNYLMQLDDKLTSVRSQINNINKQIQMYDKSVALSYVYIMLDEVVEYTEIIEEEPSFGSRIASTFVQSFKNFVTFCQELIIIIIWMLPLFMVIGIGTVVCVLLIRRRDKKKRMAYEEAKKSTEASQEQK